MLIKSCDTSIKVAATCIIDFIMFKILFKVYNISNESKLVDSSYKERNEEI